MSVLRNVSQPFGTSEPDEPNTAPTLWRTVADLKNGLYFYESTKSPFMIRVDIKMIDFDPASGARKLFLVDRADFIGDVTSMFERTGLFNPFAPDEEKSLPPVQARA
jgi:choloylglycine hydrolase